MRKRFISGEQKCVYPEVILLSVVMCRQKSEKLI